jgi:hypothetical protein
LGSSCGEHIRCSQHRVTFLVANMLLITIRHSLKASGPSSDKHCHLQVNAGGSYECTRVRWLRSTH